ncbi:MAG TPA: ABC transporter substrate-binding protein [Xanthobacteraceae bacterium]|jgi:NitT/TauT family transport system substrate-binding protein
MCSNRFGRRSHWPRAAAVALALAGWDASAAGAAEPIEIKAGIADPVNTVLAWWTAQAAGFYAEQGLKVDIMNMNGGSRGAEEVQAGRLDVMHVGLSSVVKLNRAGGDLRLIGSLSNVIRFTFFSGPGVKTAADLKGGVVGVSTFGSESDSTVTLALQRLGLARSDVTLKEYGGGPRRLAAVKSGEIKATTLNEPFTSLAREQGVNVMVDLVPEQIAWLFSGITVSRQSLASRRDALTRFLKATIEGNYLALRDEKRAKEILAKELKITDPRIIDISYNDFRQQSPPDLTPSRAGAENILAQFPGGSSRPDDYVDTGILADLAKAGFFGQMQQKYGKR